MTKLNVLPNKILPQTLFDIYSLYSARHQFYLTRIGQILLLVTVIARSSHPLPILKGIYE